MPIALQEVIQRMKDRRNVIIQKIPENVGCKDTVKNLKQGMTPI
jgi:hypothetical protein